MRRLGAQGAGRGQLIPNDEKDIPNDIVLCSAYKAKEKGRKERGWCLGWGHLSLKLLLHRLELCFSGED